MPIPTRRTGPCQVSFEELNNSGRDVRAPGARASRPLTMSQFTLDKALVLKLRVAGDPNPLRERGIVLLRFTKCLEKSLADASGCDHSRYLSAID